MNVNDVRWVVRMIDRMSIPRGTRWFLFGSVLDGKSLTGDIDILILYRTVSEVIMMR